MNTQVAESASSQTFILSGVQRVRQRELMESIYDPKPPATPISRASAPVVYSFSAF